MINSAPAPTIISTDPGIDDAVAIAIALGIGIVVSLPRFFFTLRRKGSTT